MAGAVIRVNARIVSRKLKRAARNAERMRDAFREVGEVVLRSVRKNFDVGGRPQKWAKRSTSYKGRRASNKLLIDTGRLINSITYDAFSSYVDVGTNVVYAATHQYGRDAIPARPFLMLQDEDAPAIRDAIVAHLTQEFD